MRKGYLLLIVVALLCLAGCHNHAPAPTDSPHTEPPLPTLNQSLPPEAQLQAAIDALQGKKLRFAYGSGLSGQWKLITTQDPQPVEALVPNQTFLSQFSAMKLVAIPSNDGTFCYRVTDLSPDGLCRLLCGRDLTEEEQQRLAARPEATATVSLMVDKEGRFRSLEAELPWQDSTWTLQIQIEVLP